MIVEHVRMMYVLYSFVLGHNQTFHPFYLLSKFILESGNGIFRQFQIIVQFQVV